LNDSQVEREERNFLRTLVTKTPLLKEVADSMIQQDERLADFKYQGEPAYALGIAYLLNALAVSFHSEPRWNSASLELEITRLEDHTTEELTLTTSTEKIIHASQREHILGHKGQIQERLCAEPWHPQDGLLSCYISAKGKNPLAEWLGSLVNPLTKEIIKARLNQVKQGTLGDCKPVGEGVFELRIFHGPGYRIYYGQVAIAKLLLLHGGDKSTQDQDIIKAKQYWLEYKQQRGS
jgi:putative addiction module killer protein